jgi:DNA repair protein RecN (Recombination protein N)
MLIELSVSNFGIAEHIRWSPGTGLVVLTGETGAGKSLLVTALGFLLGDRAQSEWLRSGADRAEVAGLFVSPVGSGRLLKDLGITPGDDFIVRRELTASGRSRTWVNDRPITQASLRALTEGLCDLHGQHQHQWLLNPEHHADYLDRFIPGDETSRYAHAFRQWQRTRAALDAFLGELSTAQTQKDFWTFQLAEFERVDPQPGEYEELERKRSALRRSTDLAELYRLVEAELSAADDSVAPRLGHLVSRLNRDQSQDEQIAGWIGRLEVAKSSVEEVASSVSRALLLEDLPEESLEQIEGRLHALYSLKKKFGGSMERVLRERDQLTVRLQTLEDSEVQQGDLEKARSQAWSNLEETAARLNAARGQAASDLTSALSGPLSDLGLGKSAISVAIRDLAAADWTEQGSEAVEFMLETNPGETPKPLAKIASGGELSRIMLALKSVLPGTDRVGTLVFDEVDTGIGGETAARVAELLAHLSRGRQVIVISHLHQIASRADVHFEVTKTRSNGRYVPSVKELTDPERVAAVGRLIAGGSPTPEALAAARVMVEASRSD